jgi:SAM-dependent methyltransferase
MKSGKTGFMSRVRKYSVEGVSVYSLSAGTEEGAPSAG